MVCIDILHMCWAIKLNISRIGSRIQESHVIVEMLDGFEAAVVFGVVRHTSAMAMSRTAPRTVASFASSTGEPFHTRTPPCHTIAFATIGTLHDAVCDVGGRCRVAPCKPSGAHALRAIAPTPTGPAITPSQNNRITCAERGAGHTRAALKKLAHAVVNNKVALF